ncbi:MAG: helix-turn-helix transcriptional regulator [Clostridia bacterium]|nr:helix-turn-helix transcriptional regulator [Clostridia bacterium]
MTLQEKIIKLRKKNGWSQEELADKLYVTRQAVSKWESGNSLPDVEKIVHMSKLFGVTTDYLLNEEMESADIIEESIADDNKIL